MIIKSMARKDPSFAQLFDYISHGQDNSRKAHYTFSHNFHHRERDDIIAEFERNAALLRQRKNGNYLYHEVISITRAKGITAEEQKRLLHHVVKEYVHSRASDCLVYGELHDEKEINLHFHLMISANALNHETRYRVTKKQFADMTQGLERYVLTHLPQLEQKQLISKQREHHKTSSKEYEYKKRTGKKSQKEIFRERLHSLFEQSQNKHDYLDRLAHARIAFYVRGNTLGFTNVETGRKHRLKTLGLETEFAQLSQRIGLEFAHSQTQQQTHESQGKHTQHAHQASQSQEKNNAKHYRQTSDTNESDTASSDQARQAYDELNDIHDQQDHRPSHHHKRQ